MGGLLLLVRPLGLPRPVFGKPLLRVRTTLPRLYSGMLGASCFSGHCSGAWSGCRCQHQKHGGCGLAGWLGAAAAATSCLRAAILAPRRTASARFCGLASRGDRRSPPELPGLPFSLRERVLLPEPGGSQSASRSAPRGELGGLSGSGPLVACTSEDPASALPFARRASTALMAIYEWCHARYRIT